MQIANGVRGPITEPGYTGETWMIFSALIEIVREPEGGVPAPLVRSIYKASASGVFVLALRDIHPLEIDALLDDLVRVMPLSIPGIRYIDARDPAAVLKAAASTSTIIAATLEFVNLFNGNAEDIDEPASSRILSSSPQPSYGHDVFHGLLPDVAVAMKAARFLTLSLR